MRKFYPKLLLPALFVMCVFTTTAQSIPEQTKDSIEGLSIYPNPASGDKIFITSKFGLTKQINIYDVLGSRILFKVLVGNALDVSMLKSGIYYIEVTEGKKTQMVKLSKAPLH